MSKVTMYRNFKVAESALELAELLKESGIEYQLSETMQIVDPSITGISVPEFQVLLSPIDFPKANQIERKLAQASLGLVEPDHYLFDFELEELREIVEKPDEWSAFDFELARKLLADQGQTVSEENVDAAWQKRIKELASPENSDRLWVIAGFATLFFGGIASALIGFYLWKGQKTLPNGKKVANFSQKSQTYGRFLFFLGLLILAGTTYLNFLFVLE